jgi:hypothetical protein
MDNVSEQGLLEVLAAFDGLGGTSIELAAWELFAPETKLAPAWASIRAHDWVYPAGRDDVYDEQLWRLTDAGWSAVRSASLGAAQR